jgi:ACS family glucarate transporter-like MFS transporter
MNPANLSTLPTLEKPTRVRYGVLGFVCTLSMITYLDRVCMSNAEPFVRGVLGLTSEADFKWFFWAFSISYALFEVPTGWLGDVFGPRQTIIRIVLWWSLFTVLTGLVGFSVMGFVLGSGSLIVIRFLFGLGEAGAYPNLTRALHNWFPYQDRAFAQGAMWMSGRLIGGLTPLVWWLLVEQLNIGWRGAFYLFGVFGVLWCIAFAVWFRNTPDEKPEVNEAERHLIRGGRRDIEAGHARVPWGRLLTNVNLWMLCLMYFCAAYGWYFNITLLPTYLETQHGVSPKSALGALYKGGPLWMGAITCLLGGWMSDRFIQRTGNRKWGRRLFGVVGYSVCGLCYLGCLGASTKPAASNETNAFLFFLTISQAAFWNDLIMGSAWAVCQDIGKRYSAIVAGCMNTIGNLGGAVTILVTGYILDYTLGAHATSVGVPLEALKPPPGEILSEELKAVKAAGLLPGYQINFLLYALIYFLGVLFWLRVDATKPVVPEEA